MCAVVYSTEYHLVVCVHSWTKRMIPSSCVIRLEEKQWEEQPEGTMIGRRASNLQ